MWSHGRGADWTVGTSILTSLLAYIVISDPNLLDAKNWMPGDYSLPGALALRPLEFSGVK